MPSYHQKVNGMEFPQLDENVRFRREVGVVVLKPVRVLSGALAGTGISFKLRSVTYKRDCRPEDVCGLISSICLSVHPVVPGFDWMTNRGMIYIWSQQLNGPGCGDAGVHHCSSPRPLNIRPLSFHTYCMTAEE
jgi:hypothetical protein